MLLICCYTPSIHGSLTNMYQMSPVEIATPWIDRVDWIAWHLGNPEMFHTSNTKTNPLNTPKLVGFLMIFPCFFRFSWCGWPPNPAPFIPMARPGAPMARRFRVMDTDPEIWTSLMWCNFLRPVESRVYEEAKDKTKATERWPGGALGEKVDRTI